VIDGVFAVFVVLFYGLVLFGLQLSLVSFVYITVVAFVTVASMMGFDGLCYYGLLRRDLPGGMLPGAAQVVSRVLPLTHRIEAACLAALEHFSTIPYLLIYGVIIGVILFCFGSIVLIFFEQLAKKRGRLVFF